MYCPSMLGFLKGFIEKRISRMWRDNDFGDAQTTLDIFSILSLKLSGSDAMEAKRRILPKLGKVRICLRTGPSQWEKESSKYRGTGCRTCCSAENSGSRT